MKIGFPKGFLRIVLICKEVLGTTRRKTKAPLLQDDGVDPDVVRIDVPVLI